MLFWKKSKIEHRNTVSDITMDEFFFEKYYPNSLAVKKLPKHDYSSYRTHISPYFGSQKLSQLNSRNITEWRNNQITKGLKRSTINKHLVFLVSIIKKAYIWDYIDEQLHLKIDVRKLPTGDHTQRFLSKTEIRQLLDGCKLSPHPYLFFAVKMLLLTGARIGEVLNSKWIDIDEEKCLWRVPVSKNGRSREIFLSEDAVSTFHAIKKKSESLGTLNLKDGFVFVNPRTKTKYHSFYTAWYKVVRSGSLKDVRIHDLRHTFASLLINNGVSIYEVQRLLGHSNITMTQRYAHLLKDRLHEKTEVVSRSVKGTLID
jgi:integrase